MGVCVGDMCVLCLCMCDTSVRLYALFLDASFCCACACSCELCLVIIFVAYFRHAAHCQTMSLPPTFFFKTATTLISCLCFELIRTFNEFKLSANLFICIRRLNMH